MQLLKKGQSRSTGIGNLYFFRTPTPSVTIKWCSDDSFPAFIAADFGTTYDFYLRKYLNEALNIQTGLGLVEKNYDLINTVGIKQKFTNRYFTVPIKMTFKKAISNKFFASISFGGYGSYWLSSSITGKVPNVFNIRTDSENKTLIGLEQVKSVYNFRGIDNRFECGILSGSAIEFKINPVLYLNTQYEVQYALNSQQKSSATQQDFKRNITQLFVLGINLNIH